MIEVEYENEPEDIKSEVKKLEKNCTPEEVQQIFKQCLALYRTFGKKELFRTLSMTIFEEDEKKIPEILSDVFLFFKRNERAYFDDEFSQMIKDCKEVYKKHEGSLFCEQLLFDMMNIIEEMYKERKKK